MSLNCILANSDLCSRVLGAVRVASQQQLSLLLRQSIPLSVDTGLYALSGVAFIISMYLICTRTTRTNLKPSLAMAFAILTIFAVSSACYALTWLLLTTEHSSLQFAIEAEWALYNGDYLHIDAFEKAQAGLLVLGYKLNVIVQYIPLINYVLCNLILLWRAWVLWNHSLWILLLSALFVLGTSAMAILRAIYGSSEDFSVANLLQGLTFEESMKATVEDWVIWGIFLATNTVATALIIVKVWRHRGSVRSNLEGRRRRSKVEVILALFVESGIISCCAWVSYMASQVTVLVHPSEGAHLCTEVMSIILAQITGILPTLIIVLVLMKRTASDITGLPALEEVEEHNGTDQWGVRTLAGKRQSIQPSSFFPMIMIETRIETTRDNGPDSSRGSPVAESKDGQFPDIEGTTDGHGSDEIMSSTDDKLDVEWIGEKINRIR